VSIIAIATSKGGAGKTTLARLLVGLLSQCGYKVAAVDTDFNHTLTDWVNTLSNYPVTAEHELDETKLVPLIAQLHDTHDVVVIDTAGAASQATIFAIGCADLVLVPVQTSSADVVEAIKTMNLIKSAGLMMKRNVLARVVLNAHQPNTNLSAHIEKELIKAKLPVMKAKLQRLVAWQEMSFTGIVPMTALAGVQGRNFVEEIEEFGALPESKKLAS
jgi:chromosome partitioning protein